MLFGMLACIWWRQLTVQDFGLYSRETADFSGCWSIFEGDGWLFRMLACIWGRRQTFRMLACIWGRRQTFEDVGLYFREAADFSGCWPLFEGVSGLFRMLACIWGGDSWLFRMLVCIWGRQLTFQDIGLYLRETADFSGCWPVFEGDSWLFRMLFCIWGRQLTFPDLTYISFSFGSFWFEIML